MFNSDQSVTREILSVNITSKSASQPIVMYVTSLNIVFSCLLLAESGCIWRLIYKLYLWKVRAWTIIDLFSVTLRFYSLITLNIVYLLNQSCLTRVDGYNTDLCHVKLYRAWSPNPPSRRLMIKVFDQDNYNSIMYIF